MITPPQEDPINARILSFDPGVMTGISYLKDGKFQWGIVSSDTALINETFTLALTKMTQPTVVLVEVPPRMGGIFCQEQMDVYHYVKRWYSTAGYRVAEIYPGYWK